MHSKVNRIFSTGVVSQIAVYKVIIADIHVQYLPNTTGPQQKFLQSIFSAELTHLAYDMLS